MTRQQKEQYHDPAELKEILRQALATKKFFLQCGHSITFFHHFGNDLTIRNGKEITVICSQCGY